MANTNGTPPDTWDLPDYAPSPEEILAAAAAYTPAEAYAAMNRCSAYAAKATEDLTAADHTQQQKNREILENHPMACPVAWLLPCRGKGPDWLDEYITHLLWSWAWWADFFNEPIDAYLPRGTPPHVIEAVKAARPYPENFNPRSERRWLPTESS